MSGKSKLQWLVRLTLALAIGAVTVPVAPAFAQAPDLGSDWVLTGSKRIKTWVPNPKKPGRGKWKLKAVKDRKYFVADDLVNKTTDKVLDNTKITKEETERLSESATPERVTLNPIVKETTRKVEGNKAASKKFEGRFVNTYHNWNVETVKDTETRVPFEDWENVTYQERKKQYLKNQYRLKTELTFQDPKTKGQMKAKSETLEAPVDEISYTKEVTKKDRRFKSRGENVSNASKVVSTQAKVAKIASAPGSGPSGEGGDAALANPNIGYSGDTGRGGSSARFVASSKVQKLAGSQKVTSRGGSKLDLDLLFTAAKAVASLFDDQGAKWSLGSDGKALVFTPAGGDGIRLEKGQLVATGGKGARVKLEGVSVDRGHIVLTGDFDAGKFGKASKVLRTK